MGTIGKRVLWGGAAVALMTAAVLIGYRYDITLWDWAKLLIVPAVIAGGGLWFNAQQREREQQIAHERAQDDALQAYLEGMSGLLTDKDRPLHRAQPGDSLSLVARARTLTVLSRLDADRKARVMQFLSESGLIAKDSPVLYLSGADLRGANLRVANLNNIDLHEVDLREASLRRAYLNGANLSAADLREADLIGAHVRGAKLLTAELGGADLFYADLREADLRMANLERADLRHASLAGVELTKATMRGTDLRGAHLSSRRDPWEKLRLLAERMGKDLAERGELVELSAADQKGLLWADLRGADLSEVKLEKTDLSDANLQRADLTGATGWTEEQLAAAYSLEGATMPNGQKYEDWLKSKGNEEDG